MIHLVLREPTAYQRTLCQALSDSYEGAFVAWFAEKTSPIEPRPAENFTQHFLSEIGYASLYRQLRADPQAKVILGSWSSAIAFKTLMLAMVLRVPVLIWTDHPHPRKRNRVLDWGRKAYLRFLGRRVTGFLACGKPTALHLESLGIARAKITEFPYWVDVPKNWSAPRGCENAAEPLRLIVVGRHVAAKAFDVAIEAVALANDNAGRRIATLQVIGDGPEREKLERLAGSLMSSEVTEFVGWVSNQEVWNRLRESDALIVPSRFEPYGVVVLEALANGRPVLASEQVMAALDRDNGQGAILFHAAGEPSALGQQIKLLAEDRVALRVASEGARSVAEEWPPERAAAIL